MDRTAIEKIAEMAKPNIIENNNFTYTDKTLKVISEPVVDTIEFSTLRGMVETLKKEIDNFDGPMIVIVSDHYRVEIKSAINAADRSRENPYTAISETTIFNFNRHYGYEEMIIALKSKFVETPELLELVQLLGNITNEQSAQTLDDGFSQNVVVKKGIALKENKTIKPIIKLRPYRTFLEVEQPESEFLIRLHDGNTAALYEADGGAWKLKARTSIAEYLRENLSELIENGKVIVVE